ncbi:reverse transcriptase domain-containing protein [Niastella sp. OAS944]|uniref:RNA-directed DNA polymerase n=1 Tax=Niastella sp. OAS944 TaxID=2664089 RepID=UPI003492A446|nr:hypothetical protein [Chitinophagaceae bacterium OAS944]
MINPNEGLSEYFDEQSLRLAWERMKCSNGRDVRDFFGIEVFSISLKSNLKALSEKIAAGNYQPQRPFKYYEPKASRTHRTKTVLFIEDAIVYQAIANRIAFNNFENLNRFNDYVFGSVLHPQVAGGNMLLDMADGDYYFFDYYVPLYNRFVNSVNKELENPNIRFKLETDITGFFDSIPHSKLLIALSRNFQVPDVILELLKHALNVWSGTRDSVTFGVGIPQGPAASFFFANVLLAGLDEKITTAGYAYYRYMDDIRIYEEKEDSLQDALILIDNYLKSNSLSLNTKKTSIEEIKVDRNFKKSLASPYDDDEGANLSREEGLRRGNDLHAIQNDFAAHDVNDVVGTEDLKRLTVEELIEFCHSEIEIVAIELPKRMDEIGMMSEHLAMALTDHEIQREIIDLAFRWRNAANILKSIGRKPILHKSLIPYWIEGITHMFWKANHFCWNLNQYGPDEHIKHNLLKLFQKFKQLEWVRYQILSNMALVQRFNLSELRHFFRELLEEQSELTRLGYYQLLLSHLEVGQQLLTAVNTKVSQEKSLYLRQYLALGVAKRQGLGNSEIIKNWFGL